MVNLSDHVSARVNGQNRITQKRNFDKLEFNVGFFIYFFPQRTKPRGVIDLGYASVYTVHESLFNQPNCFQIVVKVTNDMEVYYLNAETQQLSEVMLQFIYQSMYDVRADMPIYQLLTASTDRRNLDLVIFIKLTEHIHLLCYHML